MRLDWRPIQAILLMLVLCTAGVAQTATTPGKPTAPELRELTGDDVKRAAELDKAMYAAAKADRWEEAIARAQEMAALRARAQGPMHSRSVNANWTIKLLRRVAALPKEERVAYLSARTMTEQARALKAQGKYAAAQPLVEEALEITRRILTDDHPATALCYYEVASNLKAEGKYAAAQPLYEKAMEIFRRTLTDDHISTASSLSNLAENLTAQGRYAEAQPLYQKALEIGRRLLSDDHTITASFYTDVALNLAYQGKYAQAQPLLEKALEIDRRTLTDEDHRTALDYNNLAFNLNAQGKYAQARPLFERALEIDRHTLPDGDPGLTVNYFNLAYTLAAQGNYAAAQPLYEKALEIDRRTRTDNHPDTAKSYSGLAANLDAQGKHDAAQPLHEKALEIFRRTLPDDHPDTATGYKNLAANLEAQGKYAAAQPLLEKAVEIRRRTLTDDHPRTAGSYHDLAANLDAQGRYPEARDRWLTAVRSLDASRLRVAFSGLERAGGSKEPVRPALAAVLARLGQPARAWRSLEEDLGRGLLDELAARQGRRFTPAERDRLAELTAALERLDKLVDATPKGLDAAGRAARFEDLKRQRALASIALGEFQSELVRQHDDLAGQVAGLDEIQAALPADAALVAWVDIAPAGPNAADPDGEHWGVVVRARGIPAWIPIAGTGPDGLWTREDTSLAGRLRTELRRRNSVGAAELRPLLEGLRARRLEPLARALGASADGLPPARRLIVLPSRAMAGIPVEALMTDDDTRTVSYAPSATVFRYLRQRPRPDRHAGLLALGDPMYGRPDESSEPKPMPDHGLLVTLVVPGSNADTHGLKPGDILLAYNGRALKTQDDLKVVAGGDKPIGVDVWSDGRSSRRDLAPGRLGLALDPRPAHEAIAANRAIRKVLQAARSGDEDFSPLPGTRYEVEALARLFRSDDRPSRILLAADASEPEFDRIAASGDLKRFGFIHLATHGVIDEDIPARSAVILTQVGLPDPLEQALNNRTVFDGRLSVREIQRGWELDAELVTLSACETALGRQAGGEGFVGFTQALLMSGTRSVVLSFWKVDDKATALLMTRFYQDLLGRRPGLSRPMPKAEALREAKQWLRNLTADEAGNELAALDRGPLRPLAKDSGGAAQGASPVFGPAGLRPYAHPYYWAAFILLGDPE